MTKFRGLNENDEWLFGMPINFEDEDSIIMFPDNKLFTDVCVRIEKNMPVIDLYYEIKKNTLGQFTGLTDENGKEIFEGDIVKYTRHSGYNLDSFVAEIVWINSIACFGYTKLNLKEDGFYDVFIHPFSEHDEFEIDILPYLEVIGNIYQNPELL